jgi:dTMP kinase
VGWDRKDGLFWWTYSTADLKAMDGDVNMPTGLEDLKFTTSDIKTVVEQLESATVKSTDGYYIAPQPAPKKMVGTFIVIEGPDGVGKTRLTQWIAKNLRKFEFSVVQTREPSDGSIGCRIREMLRGEIPAKDAIGMSKLYAEDRIDHLARIVLPALRGSEIVVCDRYLLSSIAYQHGAMGLSLSDVLAFNRYAIVPDLTLILRSSPDICAARRKERGDAPSMFEDEETQRKIRRVYDNPFDFIESHNPVMVDASGDFDSVLEACMGQVMSTIEEVSK